jgi:hypothetical protein
MNELLPSKLADTTHESIQKLGSFFGELVLNALPWILLFTFIAFLLALSITIYLARKNLLKRHVRIWNIAAKLTYLVVLIGLPLFGGALGAVYGTQRLVNQSLAQQLRPAIEEKMPAMRAYLASQVKEYQPDKLVSVKDLIDPLVNDLYYKPKSESAWEHTKARWINEKILRNGADIFLESLQQVILTKLAAVDGLTAGSDIHGQPNDGGIVRVSASVMTKFTSDVTKEVDFSQLDKSLPQVFVDALTKKINSYFQSIYAALGLICLGIALIIISEILIYRRYYLRRQSLASMDAERQS